MAIPWCDVNLTLLSGVCDAKSRKSRLLPPESRFRREIGSTTRSIRILGKHTIHIIKGSLNDSFMALDHGNETVGVCCRIDRYMRWVKIVIQTLSEGAHKTNLPAASGAF